MGSRDFFAMRVIRCPACHARLPVEGAQTIVRCEYCDAHVQLGAAPKKKAKPAATPVPAQAPVPPPLADAPVTHVAQPHYSGFAWVVLLVPLMSVVGVAVSVFASMGLQWGDVEMLWHDLTQSGSSSRSEPASEPETVAKDEPNERASSKDEEDEEEDEDTDEAALGEEEPGRVGRLFSDLAERADQAESEKDRAAARRRQRAAARKEPEPTGPVLSRSEAQAALEPGVLECMKAAKVHHVDVRMGNSKVGPVSILTSASVSKPRVDGAIVDLPKTPLGRCINDAGRQIRTSAIRGAYLIISVRNPSVPNPLGHLPKEAPKAALEAAFGEFDAEVQACAKKHGAEGRGRRPIHVRVDGPTGKLIWARPSISRAFDRCVEAVYRKGAYPKAQRHEVKYVHFVEL